MRVDFSRLALAVFGFLPLLLISLWAYLPAEPHDYLSLREMLLEPYAGAGRAMDPSLMYLRQFLVLVVSLVLLGTLLRWARTAAQALLAGVLASLLLALPVWVPVVMEGPELTPTAFTLGLFVAAAGLVALIAYRLPATAAPVAALCLLAGVGLSVRTAAEVTLRSQPPLFVLAEAVRSPQSARAQLAVGLHLYSIGGVAEALPYLRDAGQAILRRYEGSGDEAMLTAARQLAALATSAENDATRSPPAGSEEKTQP